MNEWVAPWFASACPPGIPGATRRTIPRQPSAWRPIHAFGPRGNHLLPDGLATRRSMPPAGAAKRALLRSSTPPESAAVQQDARCQAFTSRPGEVGTCGFLPAPRNLRCAVAAPCGEQPAPPDRLGGSGLCRIPISASNHRGLTEMSSLWVRRRFGRIDLHEGGATQEMPAARLSGAFPLASDSHC